MKTVGELMKELGFNPNSSEDAQKAFIKHLIGQAYPKDSESRMKPETNPPEQPVQLEFDLGDTKKVS